MQKKTAKKLKPFNEADEPKKIELNKIQLRAREQKINFMN